MTERTRYAYAIRNLLAPWLQRSSGGKFFEAIGSAVDELVDRASDGVKSRFPGLVSNESLGLIGRERRIRRGPSETDTTYARQLRIWLDAHRTRGGPYALLRQLRAYWLDTLNVPIDLVYQTGRRYQMDTNGAIVRDDLTWSTGPYFDGASPEWARIWIFFYVTSLVEPLTDEFGDPIVDEHGDPITVDLLLSDTLPDEWVESFSLVPREWSAAHVKRTTIVLLRPDARLWGYPRPVRKWGDGWKWGTPKPIRIVLEG